MGPRIVRFARLACIYLMGHRTIGTDSGTMNYFLKCEKLIPYFVNIPQDNKAIRNHFLSMIISRIFS